MGRDIHLSVPTKSAAQERDTLSRLYKLEDWFVEQLLGVLPFMGEPDFWDGTEEEKIAAMGHAQDQIYQLIKGSTAEVEDTCTDYAPGAAFISYLPTDPFSQPDTVPSGWGATPFYVADTEAFGQKVGDVITDIGRISGLNIISLIASGLPRFKIEFDGAGVVELHLIDVPLGGLALITLDGNISSATIVRTATIELLDLDSYLAVLAIIIGGAFTGSLYVEHIVEIPVESSGSHYIDVTFIPNISTDNIIAFGGGLRKVVLCSEDMVGEVNFVPQFDLEDGHLRWRPTPDAEWEDLGNVTGEDGEDAQTPHFAIADGKLQIDADGDLVFEQELDLGDECCDGNEKYLNPPDDIADYCRAAFSMSYDMFQGVAVNFGESPVSWVYSWVWLEKILPEVYQKNIPIVADFGIIGDGDTADSVLGIATNLTADHRDEIAAIVRCYLYEWFSGGEISQADADYRDEQTHIEHNSFATYAEAAHAVIVAEGEDSEAERLYAQGYILMLVAYAKRNISIFRGAVYGFSADSVLFDVDCEDCGETGWTQIFDGVEGWGDWTPWSYLFSDPMATFDTDHWEFRQRIESWYDSIALEFTETYITTIDVHYKDAPITNIYLLKYTGTTPTTREPLTPYYPTSVDGTSDISGCVVAHYEVNGLVSKIMSMVGQTDPPASETSPVWEQWRVVVHGTGTNPFI